MNRFVGAISALTLAGALAACGQTSPNADNMAAIDNANTANVAELPANDLGANPTAAVSGQQFADMAAASDMFEIQSSRLALDKSKSDAVKTFARQMIDAHTQSSAKLKVAAAAATPPIKPAEQMPADKQAKLDALGAAADFDAAYIRDQTAAHEEALSMLQNYAAGGDAPSLKAFAAETAPIVSHHLEMARGLKP